jgi:AcrR family transcriptional regulator
MAVSSVRSGRKPASGNGRGADARPRNARGEGERLRAALMEATGELLLEQGSSERLSIRAITARAGVSPTALYLHFADKDELLGAVCDEAFAELRDYLRAASAAHEEPRAQLRAMGEAYITFAFERSGHYRILFGTSGRLSSAGVVEPAAEDPGMDAFAELLGATARCIGAQADPRPVALQLWTALHGFVSLRSVLPNFGWPGREEFLQQLLDAHV